jgi:hypothetical protein
VAIGTRERTDATQLERSVPALVLVGVALLCYLAVVQTYMLMSPSAVLREPLEVVLSEPIQLSEPVEVETGYGGLSVAIDSVSPSVALPVAIESSIALPIEVEGVSTFDELNVNLRNHFIVGGDPIPVQISN